MVIKEIIFTLCRQIYVVNLCLKTQGKYGVLRTKKEKTSKQMQRVSDIREIYGRK